MLLPRTAKEQSQVGDVIDKKELKPGDLVFFNTMKSCLLSCRHLSRITAHALPAYRRGSPRRGT